MITFEAIPNSFRQLKISEDGGGSRITLDFWEADYNQAFQLSLLSGKRVKFVATEVLTENVIGKNVKSTAEEIDG